MNMFIPEGEKLSSIMIETGYIINAVVLDILKKQRTDKILLAETKASRCML